MKTQSVPSDVGFADGQIEAYSKERDTVVVTVRTWNDRQLVVTFRSVVRLLDNDAGDITDLCEVLEMTTFMQEAIDHVYQELPELVPYRHFQFIGLDDEPVLEVVAEIVTTSVPPGVAL